MSRFVLCTRVGAGTGIDPWRAPFPTYQVIVERNDKMLIAIPDDDAKDDNGDLPATNTQALSAWLAAAGIPAARIAEIVARVGFDPQVTLAVSPAIIARWKARLDRRYREHAGEYDVNVG